MNKYRQKGVKREHHVIQGCAEVYEQIARLPEVKSVIPGRIRRLGGGRALGLSIQYETETGLKCLAKSGGAVQELFVVTDDPAAARQAMQAAGLLR